MFKQSIKTIMLGSLLIAATPTNAMPKQETAAEKVIRNFKANACGLGTLVSSASLGASLFWIYLYFQRDKTSNHNKVPLWVIISATGLSTLATVLYSAKYLDYLSAPEEAPEEIQDQAITQGI